MKIEMAYLFKKKIIEDGKKNHEIFMIKDVVIGLSYRIKDGSRHFHIITGNLAGSVADIISCNEIESDDVVAIINLDKASEANEYIVDFSMMKKKLLGYHNGKYYVKSSANDIDSVRDKKLISLADRAFSSKTESDFDEDEFDKTSDISSMYSKIKNTIISQDEQIMIILTSIFKNQKVVNSNMNIDLMSKLKENLLIFGSTGTGKTEILKCISRLYDIPIVIEDATSLSETGYHGRNITDMLEDLLSAAKGNLELAEKGILVIDEFDKLSEKCGDSESHVSRTGVQRGLLKLLDGSEFYFNNKKFNTSKLTVVALGAFTGIVNNTTKESTGYNNNSSNTDVDLDNYRNVTIDDFTRFGIIRELIGRFSKLVAMNPLKKEDIAKILVESNFSPLNTYKELFDLMEIGFEYSDDFVNWLAEKAVNRNSGARGLKTAFDECMSGAMFRIFAGEYTKVSLVKPTAESEKTYVLTQKNQK